MCFFQDGLHDLRFIILLDLLERISTLLEAFPEFCMVASNDNDEVYPAFGESFAAMPIQYLASLCDYRFQLVE